MAGNGGRPARTVLVTGAAGGLGSVMVAALLADGHRVAAVDADAPALERLAARLAGMPAAGGDPPPLLPIACDLAGPDAGREAVRAATAAFGPLHALVNNAGIGSRHLPGTRDQSRPGLEEIPLALWDRFFAINTRAPMLLAQAALPGMRAAGWGRIVNVTTSFRSMLHALPYGATKAALESMSAAWAAELAGSGITVNVLVPGGPTDTPFVPDIGMPRGSMLRPGIMAAPIRWLLSDGSGGFHGRRITAARWPEGEAGPVAAEAASRPIGWPELAADAVWGRPATAPAPGPAAGGAAP
jgi:NAD(P)-dependent dehydrogenase (short-subunit alcohol dehydrogenase family)